jgi:hypothetical protein
MENKDVGCQHGLTWRECYSQKYGREVDEERAEKYLKGQLAYHEGGDIGLAMDASKQTYKYDRKPKLKVDKYGNDFEALEKKWPRKNN